MSVPSTLGAVEDTRGRADDPLLDSLLSLCSLHQKDVSRATLSVGLPLKNQRLTPDLLPRAAARAGLQGKWIKRKLSDIPEIALPVLLLLKNERSALLLGWAPNGAAQIMPSETDGGVVTVPVDRLQEDYEGSVFYAQPRHRFDLDRGDLIPRAKSWFKDTLKRSQWLYVDAVVATFLINMIGLITPLFVMNVYDRVVPNQAYATLWVLAIGVCGAFVFDLLLKSLRSVCLDLAGKKTDLIISATLFERITGMSLKVRPQKVGNFAQYIHEFQSLRDFLSSLTLTSLIDLPFTLLVLIVIAALGGYLVFIPIVIYPIILGLGWVMQKPLAETLQKTMQLAGERQSSLIETLTSIESIKANNAESERQYQWEQTLGTLSKLEMRAKTMSVAIMNITMLAQQLVGVFIIIAGVYLIGDNSLTMGGLIACYMLSNRAMAPLGQLSGLLTRYQQAKVSMESINQLIQLPQERSTEERPLKKDHFIGNIELREVTFQYPGQEQVALKNINLSIKAGEKIGIIGRSGSGKSSLAKLIVGFYQPTSGSIMLDGIDMRQLDIADVRHNIGYVSQDVQLLSGTLRDNIISGARYVEDEAVLQVAELTGVHEFARTHPKGYELQVGERGQNLSGGQKQSVTMARAMLLDPPILLLDEPSSSLDNTSEERLKARLLERIQHKTLLLVTHRMSMLTLVDRLIIIDNGKVVADGPKDTVVEALKRGQVSVS